MPAPSTGLLLAGRSQRQAGSPKNPVKDLQKHFKVDPAEPVMLMFSAERDATHKRSVQSWRNVNVENIYTMQIKFIKHNKEHHIQDQRDGIHYSNF